LATGVGFGAVGFVTILSSLAFFSGTSSDAAQMPTWLGPLSFVGEVCLIIVAPVCMLVALVTFVFSLMAGSDSLNREPATPSCSVDEACD
jgi:hypothetical protein